MTEENKIIEHFNMATDCAACLGRGKVLVHFIDEKNPLRFPFDKVENCEVCNGTGKKPK
jgi:DnaJ-class molecular chaperone